MIDVDEKLINILEEIEGKKGKTFILENKEELKKNESSSRPLRKEMMTIINLELKVTNNETSDPQKEQTP